MINDVQFETCVCGYPTDKTFLLIENWDYDYYELFEFIESYFIEYGSFRWGTKYVYLVTFGWSGCEEVINAMERNELFWSECLWSSQAGGRYKFLRDRIGPKLYKEYKDRFIS